jgi:hypothetical protein
VGAIFGQEGCHDAGEAGAGICCRADRSHISQNKPFVGEFDALVADSKHASPLERDAAIRMLLALHVAVEVRCVERRSRRSEHLRSIGEALQVFAREESTSH